MRLQLPSTRRDWGNEWVMEEGQRCYPWTYDRNAAPHAPEITLKNLHLWRFVLGLDFGWSHRTAFVIKAWHRHHPELWELESFAKDEMLIDEIIARVNAYREKYPRLMIVADPDAEWIGVVNDNRQFIRIEAVFGEQKLDRL